MDISGSTIIVYIHYMLGTQILQGTKVVLNSPMRTVSPKLY